jgi:hypothetical protein
MDACSKALEASTKQVQLFQTDEKLENYMTNYATKTSVKYLGQETVGAIGSVAYVYKVVRDRSIEFRLPTFGVCESASNRITTNSYSLNLKWSMPWK